MNRLDRFEIIKASCITEPRKEGAELSSDYRDLLDYIENLLKLEYEFGCPVEVILKAIKQGKVFNPHDNCYYDIKKVWSIYFETESDRQGLDNCYFWCEYTGSWFLKDDRSE